MASLAYSRHLHTEEPRSSLGIGTLENITACYGRRLVLPFDQTPSLLPLYPLLLPSYHTSHIPHDTSSPTGPTPPTPRGINTDLTDTILRPDLSTRDIETLDLLLLADDALGSALDGREIVIFSIRHRHRRTGPGTRVLEIPRRQTADHRAWCVVACVAGLVVVVVVEAGTCGYE